MKKFNKVMNTITCIAVAIAIEALIIVGINELYYSLPCGIDTPVAYLLCIISGTKLGKWVVNDVREIIKG